MSTWPTAVRTNPKATTAPMGKRCCKRGAMKDPSSTAAGPGARASPVAMVDQCHDCWRKRLRPRSCIPRIFAAMTDGDVRRGEHPGPEHLQVDYGYPGTIAAHDEGYGGRDGHHLAPDDLGRSPSPGGPVEQTKGDGADGVDDREAPEQVGACAVVRSWRTLGIISRSTRTVTMPIGRLMTKIHRQLSEVSKPPTTGPMEPAAAPLTAHTRTPRLTRSGGSVLRMRRLFSIQSSEFSQVVQGVWAVRQSLHVLFAGRLLPA